MNKQPFFSWKGKTFSQISSIIRYNNPNIVNNYISPFFRSNPLKIYRREIAVASSNRCNSKSSVKIDELNKPNGYIISSISPSNTKGLENTLDIQYPNSFYETNQSICHTNTACVNRVSSALKRVRSSGIIKPKYSTNTNQYLQRKNRTFEQNQFKYKTNIDGTNCNPTVKPNNNVFNQQGAAVASAWTSQRKYNAITTSGFRTKIPYGSSLSNSLAYGVPDSMWNAKTKMGFPQKCTPIIKKSNGELITCKYYISKR
jgi:hypothetical protein